ncbi:hypothetical protein SMGD1_2070 [Sulfurimonas gotlandica GD1]|uniref:Uncharacterized protein n=1 Tax=Sulfurimonas gotlandica (strain DSM 19862 / JCM 16533 / GD1) TaxID=929558 RepID=B6BJ76_SULGG|nr:hypothetical protein [Sulfurimonas gotlandica]EDZ63306.1 conserved hypothetical protein [Sulfurimonas gotlandica GD1]EHP30593.1 hypothetical protein SMGD1_2070 [Sulfurimonas gotlandica GD1]
MKMEIIERYERTPEDEVILDISAEKIEDLYDDFDKKSHFLKKDLNQDLVDYITESVDEIEDEKFIIQFNLEIETIEENISRVRNSVNKFFIYMKELESRKMKDMVRTSLILLFIGLILATISVLMNQSESADTDIVFGVIAEGLTVAAWVSLWESLATFLIKWMPNRKKIRLYQRISAAKITFTFNKKI